MSDETKQLYLYGHEYAEDGTCIYITVNPIEARTIINEGITVEKAHSALGDVLATRALLVRMADGNPKNL